MKKLGRVLICLLAVVLSANVIVFAAEDVPSEWASAEVNEAVEIGFIPENMQNGYTQPITQEEFSEIAVRFLAVQFRLTLDDVINYHSYKAPSDDNENNIPLTGNIFVEQACLYGILESDGVLEPESAITREEAAQMLCNTYLAYTDADIVADADVLLSYEDRNKISDEACDATAFVSENGVMRGVSENRFSPDSSCTREQCYVMFVRLYNNAPQSRLYDNVKNLYTYEEIVDNIVNSYSYVSLFTMETEVCSVFFGYHSAALHKADTDIKIVYKNGGCLSLNEQFDYSTPFLENFTLSEDEKELYCTDPAAGREYVIDLEKAKVRTVS